MREIAALSAKPNVVDYIKIGLLTARIERRREQIRSLESRVQLFNDLELKPLLDKFNYLEQRITKIESGLRELGCSYP